MENRQSRSGEVLAEVTRGHHWESAHRGWLLITDNTGRVRTHVGDPNELFVFSRSTLKPVQALPLIMSGAVEYFRLTQEELTVICSSHSGETFHVQSVRSILKKIGLDETALKCGAHPPMNILVAHQLIRQQTAPSPLHNNCSGKHAGMLALAVFHNWDINTYLHPEHPVQNAIRNALITCSGMNPKLLRSGIDGCSAPNYSLPIRHLATIYARLANPSPLSQPYQQALQTIKDAILKYPQYLAGNDRFDTELMTHIPGIIAKCGAEGVFALALCKQGLGLALKVEDGNKRAIPAIVAEALLQLNILSPESISAIQQWRHILLKNHQQKEVGKIRPVFQLHEYQ